MAVFRIGTGKQRRAITRSRFIKSANTSAGRLCPRKRNPRAFSDSALARLITHREVLHGEMFRRRVARARARARALITARLHGENFGIILDYSNPGSLLSARARARAYSRVDSNLCKNLTTRIPALINMYQFDDCHLFSRRA